MIPQNVDRAADEAKSVPTFSQSRHEARGEGAHRDVDIDDVTEFNDAKRRFEFDCAYDAVTADRFDKKI